MDIHSGRMILSLDDKTGEIAKIVDGKTGLVHLDAQKDGRDDARLFRITVPKETWLDRNIDSHTCKAPKITRKTNGLLMRWDNCLAHGEATGVNVEVSVEELPEHEEIRFNLRVENHGFEPILNILFPCVAGWTGIGGKGKDQMSCGPARFFDPHARPAHRCMPYNSGVMFCGTPYSPWFDLSGTGGGISFISYMTEAKAHFAFVENMDDHKRRGTRINFGFLYPPLVNPGESWEAPPAGISLHGGNWRETADRYLQSTRSWFIPPPGKRELRESIGHQNVLFRGFDGTLFHRFEEIPEIARVGRAYGVPQLFFWDYVVSFGYEHHQDLDLTDYSPDEKKTIAKGLAEAKLGGTNVGYIQNFRLCPPTISRYSKESRRETIRSYTGAMQAENFGTASHNYPVFWAHWLGPSSFVLSPLANSYRERVLRQVREFIRLGFTSLFWDQPVDHHLDYGHMSEGKRPEDNVYAATFSLIKEARCILHENDPDALIMGEMCDAFGAQCIDMWMSWYYDFEQALRLAYALPHTMTSWVVDGDPAQASRAFAAGMYLYLCTHGMEGTLADEPEFAAHVAKLAALRKKCAERTVHAQFKHTRGLKIEGNDSIVAFSYDGAKGPAVIMAAPGARGRITVAVARQFFSNPGTGNNGMIHRLDGSSQPHSGDCCSLELAENEVLVWEL